MFSLISLTLFLVPQPKALQAATSFSTPSVTTTRTKNSISKRNLLTEDDYDLNENVGVALGAPLIIPFKAEVILQKDDEFTIRCEDKEPIDWKYPIELDGTAEESAYTPQDQKRTFGKSLTLTGVNYKNVGSYFCVKQSAVTADLMLMETSELTELANRNLASSIYIFVNGEFVFY